jgi:hypothetical protein
VPDSGRARDILWGTVARMTFAGEIGLPAVVMPVEEALSSPEPAVGVFTSARTCPARHGRHFVIGYADPGQNPSAVWLGSSRVRGRGLSRTRHDHSAEKWPAGDDEHQGDDAGLDVQPGAMLGATRTNDFPVLRTYMNDGQGRTRGHELI